MTDPLETEEPFEKLIPFLDSLESRSDADVDALPADRVVFDLELLLDALVSKETLYHEAVTELRATERLTRLAWKHEDVALAQGLSRDADYLQTVVPVYAERCGRMRRQWDRLWQALTKYRLPDELHDALGAIAQAEGRTPLAQITLFLKAAVAEWQAHQRRC